MCGGKVLQLLLLLLIELEVVLLHGWRICVVDHVDRCDTGR